MKALHVLLPLLLLVGCASPTQAPERARSKDVAAKPVDAALAGEYQLDGVMETGSGLRLRGDGSFEWYFSYGALDLGARGTWTRNGETVELAVAEMGFPPQFPQAKFDRMRLRIDAGGLVPSWPWDMDAFRKDGERGRYERAQP